VVNRWLGMHGREEECMEGYVRKREVKRPLGGHGRGWEHDIKMDLNERESKGMRLDSPGSG